MRERYQHAKGWTSIDLVSKSKSQLVLSTCPSVKEWLEKQDFKAVYVAILASRGHINWHRDQTHKKMSDAINLYLIGLILVNLGGINELLYLLSNMIRTIILPGDSAQLQRELPHCKIQPVMSWNIPEH